MTYAKVLAFSAALFASTVSFAAQHIPEGSYPQIAQSSVQAPARVEVAQEAVRHNLAGQPGQVKGEDRPQFVQSYEQHQLSRSQVIQERDAFARSGIARIGNEA